MRLSHTTVPLVPRSTANCLDLAVKFFARHIRGLGELWLSVALPSGLLAYLLLVQLDMDVRLVIVVLFFATLPLGVMLVAGTSRALFGDPFLPPRTTDSGVETLSRAVMMGADVASVVLFVVVLFDYIADALGKGLLPSEDYRLAVVGLLTATLSVRLIVVLLRLSRFHSGMLRVLSTGLFRRLALGIGPGLVFFSGSLPLVLLGLVAGLIAIFFFIRTGFQPEAAFLASIDRQLRGRKPKELLKSEGGDLFLRGCWIMSFCWMLSIVLFMTVDIGCETLLGIPILWGRLRDVLPDLSESGSSPAYFFETTSEVIEFGFKDPTVLAVLTAVALVAYTIARLAWFFCYIDLRVRRDLWDLELQFQQEARRLEGQAS